MFRPILYFAIAFLTATFFTIEWLGNYFDYIGDSPIFLSPKMMKLFELNRLKLLVFELAIPAGFALVYGILAIIKLRANPIRYALVLVQFLATSFWLSRAFVFPDRMIHYYQQSDPERYIDHQEGHMFFAYFVAFTIEFLLILLIREYSKGKDETGTW